MDSLSHAADIIDGTHEPAGLDALLSGLGFRSQSLPLDQAARERLGLPSCILSARVTTGEGSLRALTVELASDSSHRDVVAAVARQLSQRAPQLLWLVVVTQRNAASLVVATWRCVRSVPRISAMITHRGRIVDSDAETLCALAAASAASGDVMRHMRWLDILGRDAITQRFFLALSAAVSTLSSSLPTHVPAIDSREIALLTTSRLLFLSFLETKGWLNSDFGFLANGFADCMARGGGYQRRVLEPLFFGTLNTRVSERAPRARAFGGVPFLNGGLFARTPTERIHRHARFADDALGALFGDVLIRYRFTAREDAATWSQAAVDPEMLGKVFESLMQSHDRKRDGVFYTPQHFVERVTFLTLSTTLQGYGISRDEAEHLLSGSRAEDTHDSRLLDKVSSLRILDPACGSGAFLVHALERVAQLRIALGDTRSLSEVRRTVLTRSIFGVDSNPTAVWLCELRLWLSAVIDSDERDPMRIAPLPNLDRHIRAGDSLAGDAFSNAAPRSPTSRSISILRDRYARSSGRRKLALGRRLDIAERVRAMTGIDAAMAAASSERKEIVRAARSRDLFDARTSPRPGHRERLLHLRSVLRTLKRRRNAMVRGATPAFAYPTHFSDVADAGGFDAIIGNPPWVRAHNMPREDRIRYRERYTVFRAGAWVEGARGANAGHGFAGQVDLAALFIERSTELLAQNGTMGLLLPSKLWRSLAGGGTRELILERTRIITIEDHAEAPDAFDAAVYPSILVASRTTCRYANDASPIEVGVHGGSTLSHFTLGPHGLPLDPSPGSPWLLLPPDPRGSFDLLRRGGIPLFESIIGRPHLGVKTGCNDAFVVNAGCTDTELTTGVRGTRRGEIEMRLLRPLVRGETLTQWRLTPNDERIIWTHDKTGDPLRELPPHAHSWLTRSRRTLERRTDSRSGRWWALFRTECAESTSSRVVWADFGRAPRAAVLDAGDPTVPLNSCYSVPCPTLPDALAFSAILNSQIAAAWLSVLAEPARGGYHRYLGWTVARLPIPIDWPRARRLLAPVASRARDGQLPCAQELNAIVLEAYELSAAALQPLLRWARACDHG